VAEKIPPYKTMVVGVLERGGKVLVSVSKSRRKKELQAYIRAHVEPAAEVFTDALNRMKGCTLNTCIRGTRR
jgi:hypothetical protein